MARSDSRRLRSGRPVAPSDLRPWLGQRYFPEHPGLRTAPTEFFVIDLIAQQDIEPENQLARYGRLGRSSSLAKGQATVGTSPSRIESAGGLPRLDQQKVRLPTADFINELLRHDARGDIEQLMKTRRRWLRVRHPGESNLRSAKGRWA